jgi:rhomboid protease GluP
MFKRKRGDMMTWFVRNESFKTYIRRYRVTSLLIASNIVVFLIMTFQGGSTNTDTLIDFGAYYRPLIYEGEWYRLVAPIFLHVGWEHLLFNGFALLIFAPGLEVLLGKLKYTLFYLLTGIAGFVVTFLFSAPHVIAAGASGAIFGIYGAYAFITKFRKHLMDIYSRQTIIPILIFGVIFTFLMPGISITGHLGGLVCGFLLSYFFIKK